MAKIWNTDNIKCWRGFVETNSHSLLVGTQTGTATIEDSLPVSYKTKHTLTIGSSNHAPWYLPNRVENLGPHLHRDVIINTWEKPRFLSVDEWINTL